MNFGVVLKKLRLERKLSQKALADCLGITQQSISAYENGTSDPSIDWLIKFAQVFNISIDYLVGYSQVPGNDYFKEDQVELFKTYDALPPEKKPTAQKLLKALHTTEED